MSGNCKMQEWMGQSGVRCVSIFNTPVSVHCRVKRPVAIRHFLFNNYLTQSLRSVTLLLNSLRTWLPVYIARRQWR